MNTLYIGENTVVDTPTIVSEESFKAKPALVTTTISKDASSQTKVLGSKQKTFAMRDCGANVTVTWDTGPAELGGKLRGGSDGEGRFR